MDSNNFQNTETDLEVERVNETKLEMIRDISSSGLENSFESENVGKALGGMIQRETSLTLGKMVLPLIVVLIFGIVQSVNLGVFASDYLFLIAGSLLTIFCAFSYGLVSVGRAYGSPKKFWMFFASIGGFIPYLFFLYLTFYRGFWSLTGLFNGFSLLPILEFIFFCSLGYYGINHFHKVTELGRYVDSKLAESDYQDEI